MVEFCTPDNRPGAPSATAPRTPAAGIRKCSYRRGGAGGSDSLHKTGAMGLWSLAASAFAETAGGTHGRPGGMPLEPRSGSHRHRSTAARCDLCKLPFFPPSPRRMVAARLVVALWPSHVTNFFTTLLENKKIFLCSRSCPGDCASPGISLCLFVPTSRDEKREPYFGIARVLNRIVP